jgi:hypothetical protein
VNLIFSLRALAAEKSNRVHDSLSCLAAQEPAISAIRGDKGSVASRIAGSWAPVSKLKDQFSASE